MKLEKTTYKSTHERLEAEGFSPEQQLEADPGSAQQRKVKNIYSLLTA